MPEILSCDLHDYIEISCLYKYQLEVKLIDGSLLKATALNIIIRQKSEHLELLNQTNSAITIAVNEIESIATLSPNAQFKSVNLKTGKVIT